MARSRRSMPARRRSAPVQRQTRTSTRCLANSTPIEVPDGPGDDRLYTRAPISAIALCLVAQIERGQGDRDEVIWRRLDERLAVLEEAKPEVYEQLVRMKGAWFAAVRAGLPGDGKA